MKIRTMTYATVVSFSLMSPLALAASSGEDADTMDPMSGDMESASTEMIEFDALDANGDGVIDAEELNVYGATAAGQGSSVDPVDLEMRDQNEDGKITREEFEKGEMPSD